jgi:alcohol dehydrogenase class IV
MSVETHLGVGAISELPGILETQRAKTILLVTGPHSYSMSGAADRIDPVLTSYQTVRFSTLADYPDLPDIERGVELCRTINPDVVIAIGGGTVIDIAKLLRICSVNDAAPESITAGTGKIERAGPPLVAIPTTAGSGSEATHFAVIFNQQQKYSVAHQFVQPDFAIVDPSLTYSMSEEQTAVCGLDVLCQSIESIWSVGSSRESRTWASEAARLVLLNLVEAVRAPSEAHRESMSRAAHLAGRAINISKTTAPHALSYTLTTSYGLPHGHAVALTLGSFLEFNAEVSEEDLNDPRGVHHVYEMIGEVCSLLGAHNPLDGRHVLADLMVSIGMETRLGPYGIEGAVDCARIVEKVNVERLSNNPRNPTKAQLAQMLEKLI